MGHFLISSHFCNKTDFEQDFFNQSTYCRDHLLHSLRSLSSNFNCFSHVKFIVDDMKMFVKTTAVTPLSYNTQLFLDGVSHKQ